MTTAQRLPAHVVEHTTCTSCRRAVDLECRGLSWYLAYPVYSEFFCPYCRKQNHARTRGAVLAVSGQLAPVKTS